MFLAFWLLLFVSTGVKGQAHSPEQFCDNPPAVYRGEHFEIVVNQTVYDYGRAIEVTVKPKPGGNYTQISDFFLHVPGGGSKKFLGHWYANYPSAPAFCNQYDSQTNYYRRVAGGVKSAIPNWPYHTFTVSWVAPMPRTYRYNGKLYSYPGDVERTRPHVYFALYATPDRPTNTWAPGGVPPRKWYFAHSVKVENREIKQKRDEEKARKQWYKDWANLLESMN